MIANSNSSGQEVPPPSPYAAPNTPIASAKRPRPSNKKDHENPRSPLLVRKILTDDQLESTEPNSEAIERTSGRKTSIGGSAGPAKVLFSPALRPNESDTDSKIVIETEVHTMEVKKDEVKAMEEDDSTAVDVEEEFNPYYFISSLPPYASVSLRRICLPRDLHPDKLTLVLDLDETLVHCTVEQIPNPDLTFPVTFNGIFYQVYVRKRPHLDEFLEAVARSFEVIVFTASQQVYAEQLLNLIDKKKTLIQHRLYRDSCLCVCGNYIKDLSVVNRDLSKTVLVDNSPHAYAYQIDNGIPIESWFDDPNDQELLKLIEFLRRLEQRKASASMTGDPSSSIGDVRPVIKEHFKTYQLVDKARMGLPVRQSAPPF